MKTLLIGIMLCITTNTFAGFVTVCDMDMNCEQIWIMD